MNRTRADFVAPLNRRMARPDLAHCLDLLIHARVSFGEGRADCRVVDLTSPDPDADRHASRREDVQGGDFLGRPHGGVHGQHVEAGHNANPLGHRGCGGQHVAHFECVAGDPFATGETRPRTLVDASAEPQDFFPAKVAFHVGQTNSDFHRSLLSRA